MDISKLPKLSDNKSQNPPGQPTPAPPPLVSETSPTNSGPVSHTATVYQPPGIGADIWISLVIGILLCYLGGTFAHFVVAKLTHQPFHTGYTWPGDDPNGRAGQEVAYFDLQGFTAWSDMGVFLFGLILLFEAAAKSVLLLKPGKPARIALMLAIGLTVAGVLLNLVACAKLFSVGITPMLSGFAVAFGGWILIDEWTTLKRTQLRP